MLTLKNIFVFSETSPLLFSQYLFVFIFTIMYGIYAAIHNRLNLRSFYLICFGVFFYYRTGGWFFSLLVLSTIYDFYLANAIHNSKSKARRMVFLIISLVINLGLLAFFKYTYYFAGIANDLFGTHFQPQNIFYIASNNLFGTYLDINKIVLPVGISFFTFQTLSYTIDVYTKRIEPAKNILDFGFFVTYFPQLIAGPIVRAIDFIPQISKKFSLTEREFGHAIFLIMGGFIKKAVISDYISINFVDRVFDDPQLYSGFDNLMAVYGYAIQIYCDFSGYSDMAIGVSLLLGFRLPLNFNSPYVSLSITEFWRRWHISLSTWLKDYLYISLGGNRKSSFGTWLFSGIFFVVVSYWYFHEFALYWAVLMTIGTLLLFFHPLITQRNKAGATTNLNLMVTMLIGGFWHGAANKFIIWGALHGIGLAIHKAWLSYVPWAGKENSKIYNLIAGIVTFHFVCFCWIYFRADDVPTVKTMLDRILHNFSFADLVLKTQSYWKVFTFILVGYALHFIPRVYKLLLEEKFSMFPLVLKVGVVAFIIVVVYQIASSEVQPFIYFQF